MPTVTEAASVLEQTTDLPPATIKGVSRRLIDDGILPKSYGKNIATITLKEFAYFMLAAFTAQTNADAPRVARLYGGLPQVKRVNDNEAGQPKFGDTCADALAFLLSDIAESDLSGFVTSGYVEVCVSRPVVCFRDTGLGRRQDLEDVIWFHNLPSDEDLSALLLRPSTYVRLPLLGILQMAKKLQAPT